MSTEQTNPVDATEDEGTNEPRKFRVYHRRNKATIITSVLLLVFLVVCYSGLIPDVPWLLQKLFALSCAALFALVWLFGVSEYTKRFKYKRVQLPRLGKFQPDPTRPGPLGAVVLFLLVFIWWMTPLAPIRTATVTAEALSALLADQIGSVVLLQQTDQFAVLQTPLVPAQVVSDAGSIPDDADAHLMALKFVGQRNFAAARENFDLAKGEGQIDERTYQQGLAQIAALAADFPSAIGHFEKAQQAGSHDRRIARQLAVMHAQQGDLEQAAAMAAELTKTGKSGDADFDAASNLLAAIDVLRGRFDAAKDKLAQANDKRPVVVNTKAIYQLDTGDLKKAQLSFDDASSRWNHEHDEVQAAAAIQNQGQRLLLAGRYDEALAALNKSLATRRRGLRDDPKHPAIGDNLVALADANVTVGRYKTAADQLAEADEVFVGNKLPAGGPHRLAGRLVRARLDADQGHWSAALAAMNQILQSISRPQRDISPLAASIRVEMARIYLARFLAGGASDLRQAEGQANLALRILDQAELADQRWHDAAAESALAEALVAQDNLQNKPKANSLLRSAQSRLDRATDSKEIVPRHLQIVATKAALASVKPAQDARALLTEAIQDMEGLPDDLGKEHPQLAWLLFQRALIDQRQDRDAARGDLKRALEILRAKIPGHPYIALVLRTQAEMLRKDDPNSPEAEQLEIEAEQIIEQHAAAEAAVGQ